MVPDNSVVAFDQVWGGIICAGPTNVKLNGSFRTRNSHDYLQELGNVLANVAPKAGGIEMIVRISNHWS